MMKKLVCLVLALMLALCAMIPALAEGTSFSLGSDHQEHTQ